MDDQPHEFQINSSQVIDEFQLDDGKNPQQDLEEKILKGYNNTDQIIKKKQKFSKKCFNCNLQATQQCESYYCSNYLCDKHCFKQQIQVKANQQSSPSNNRGNPKISVKSKGKFQIVCQQCHINESKQLTIKQKYLLMAIFVIFLIILTIALTFGFAGDNTNNFESISNTHQQLQKTQQIFIEEGFNQGILIENTKVQKMKEEKLLDFINKANNVVNVNYVQNTTNYDVFPFLPNKSDETRILAHISIDKPIYRQNDVIFVEVYLIDPLTKQPLIEFLSAKPIPILENQDKQNQYISPVTADMKIIDSFDNPIFDSQMVGQSVQSNNGTLVFTYKISEEAKGGEYQILISSQSFPNVWRKFRINQYSDPYLYVTADFDQINYSPGDQVTCKIKVRKPDGTKLEKGSSIVFYVDISNNQESQNYLLDQQGEVRISFFIPYNTISKVITLSITTYIGPIQQSGVINTYSVPLLDRDSFSVDFYTEMGQSTRKTIEEVPQKLVSGVNNKIYFQVHSKYDENKGENQKLEPIEFTLAQLVEVQNQTQQIIVNQINNLHLGRSYFEFTPRKDCKYFVRVFRSFNHRFHVLKNFWLTPQQDENLSTQATINSIDDKQISFTVSKNSNRNGGFRNISVILQNKDKIIYQSILKFMNESLQSQNFIISLQDIYPRVPNGGVLIFKIIEIQNNASIQADYINLERLIYIKPQKKIEFKIKTDSLEYQPAQKVDLSIVLDSNQIAFEQGEKVYASIVVTDISSFLQVPKEKLPPSLPTMVYLEKEIKDPINPNVIDDFYYSDSYIASQFESIQEDNDNNGKNCSYLNVDLLLGVQSWRTGLLNDMSWLESQANSFDDNRKEKAFLEYVMGKKVVNNIYFMQRGGMMEKAFRFDDFSPKAMPDKMPMPAAFQDQKDENEIHSESNQDIKDQLSEGIQQKFQNDFMQDIIPNSREYEHISKNKGIRADFTQTLLFKSAQELIQAQKTVDQLILDSEFFLNDQISQFVVTVNIFTSLGKYAYAKKTLTSSQKLYSEYTMPTSFVVGDKLNIPVYIINNHDFSQEIRVVLTQQLYPHLILNQQNISVNLEPNSRKQIFYEIDTTTQLFSSATFLPFLKQDSIQVQLQVAIFGEKNQTDIQNKNTQVLLNGFNQQFSKSERIILKSQKALVSNDQINQGLQQENILQRDSNDESVSQKGELWKINLPNTLVSTPRFIARVYSKPLDSILDAIQSLIQNPTGCFEQTSSTTYPMVMALMLLQELQKSVSDPEKLVNITKMEKDIKDKLLDGYKRLIGFETSTKGYEWFGESPGHEALTAYGIAQFQDMLQVVDFVDQKSLKRNTDWLVQERRSKDNTGQFMLNTKALDTFGRAAQNITDAYILWVLTQNGYDYQYLEQEFINLQKVSLETEDPYFLALYTGALYNVGKISEAKALQNRIISQQNKDSGAVEGALSSITNSQGESLIIETTSLSIINWLNLDISEYSMNIEQGIGYLLKKVKDGGRFGSTQSTVLSLKALVLYSKYFSGMKGAGNLVLYMNDIKIKEFQFDEKISQPIQKFDFSNDLNMFYQSQIESPNEINLRISIENYKFNKNKDDFKINYLMQVDYKDSMPPTNQNAQISFELSQQEEIDKLQIGQIQKQKLTIKNLSGKAQGMVTSILSVPSCLDIDMNQIEILKDRKDIDNFEISPDKTLITFYWTYLKENESKNVIINRVKKFEGQKCMSRASQAYLYYQDEFKVWVQ